MRIEVRVATLTAVERSRWYYVQRIPRLVLDHPANAAHPVRAVTRAILWQVYKRLAVRPLDRRVYGSMRVRCYRKSASASNLIYFGDYYEWDEMHFVHRYLREGDGFIDAGANIGTYSLLAASRTSGPIHAFEPLPALYERLLENFEINALVNARAHRSAISDKRGQVEFLANADVSGRMIAATDGTKPHVMVDCVTLDEQLPLGESFALGKLDVEGAEMMALKGASGHLRDANPPAWLLEATDSQLRKFGSSRQEVVEFLAEHGFETASYDAASHELVFGPPSEQNFLAIHRAHIDMVRARLRDTPVGWQATI